MTARSWRSGDPEPSDRPAVVDSDGITWAWMECAEGDSWAWHRKQVVFHGNGGWGTGYSVASDWADMLDMCGGEVREATADEADQVTVTYRDPIGEGT